MKQLSRVFLLTVTLCLAGCMSYAVHPVPDVRPWPLQEAADKHAVQLAVQTDYRFNNRSRDGGFNVAKLQALLSEEFRASQRFDAVSFQTLDADRYARITVYNHERGSLFLALVTGISLGIIPGTASNEYIMETQFFDRDGKELGTIEKRATLRTWMQLFLVFAMPFSESPDEVLSQLTRMTLEEAVRRQWI